MYEAHFGLHGAPFSITPDLDFLYLAGPHQAALNTLRIALDGGEGFVVLTGEVGTGKTLLGRQLLAGFGADVASALIVTPRLAPQALLRAIAAELGLAPPRRMDEAQLCELLRDELLDRADRGQRVVVLVDEAQAMPADALETLRLLSNLETGKDKLLQVVLIGQPELEQQLADPRLRSLASRIGFRARLGGMTAPELRAYLAHRMAVAGWRAAPVFGGLAARLIWRASGGVPRRANLIAHKALMLAYGRGVHRVGCRLAWLAIRDTPAPARWSAVQGAA